MIEKTMMDAALHRTADNHGYSAATGSTVAPCLAQRQRGHKTMMMATPRRTSEDGVACKPS
jgi:hypothetical protein